MAQVPDPSGVPQVSASPTAPNDYQNIRPSPQDFGADVARGEQQLGQGISTAGNDMTNVLVMRQQRDNEIRTNDSFNKFQSSVQDLTWGNPADPSAPKGLYTMTGEDALKAGPQIAKQIGTMREQMKAGLANDAQKLQFDDQTRRLMQYTEGEISRHLDTQNHIYNTAVNKAQEQTADRQAGLAYNNPDALMHSLADGRAAAIRQLTGPYGSVENLDPVLVKNATDESDSRRVSAALIGAIGHDDLQSADRIMHDHGHMLDPKAFEVFNKQLQEKHDDLNDNVYIQSLPGMGGDIKAAIHGQESGGRATAPTSVDGARGGMQITPATFQQYARPGESIDNPADNQAVGNRIIDDYNKRYNGDPSRVAVAYFSGPGNVAPPGSPNPWIEDKRDQGGRGTSTSQYVAGVMSRVGGTTPGGLQAFPDEQEGIRKIISDTQGQPDRQQRLLSKFMRDTNMMKAATAGDRYDLEKSLPDVQTALMQGKPGVTIPEDQIRHLLPPAEAAERLERLQLAKKAGQAFSAIRFGTPESVSQAYDYLAQGEGQDRERETILNDFHKQVLARQAGLTNDPAGYVMSEPGVNAAALRMASGNPDDVSNYVNKTLALQQMMGVRPENQHVLTKDQAQQTAHDLMTVDPSTGDMGAKLQQLAQSYGSAWPQVFGDLKTLGKLPGQYQILASINDPADRTEYQRALATTVRKGGLEALRKDIDPDAARKIDQGIDAQLASFNQTARIPGLTNNIDLITNVRNAIQTFAYNDAILSRDGDASLTKATQAILGRYDFDGTMRVPSGKLAAVQAATSDIQNNLKPEDLAPLAADTMATKEGPGLTIAQRQAVTLDAAQRGKWIPNESDTGLVLAGTLRNGTMVRMQRADGSRIEFKFKQLDDPATSPKPQLQQPKGMDSVLPGLSFGSG